MLFNKLALRKSLQLTIILSPITEVLAPESDEMSNTLATSLSSILTPLANANVVVVTQPSLVALETEYQHRQTPDMEYQSEILERDHEEILIARDIPISQPNSEAADSITCKGDSISEEKNTPQERFMNYETLM